MEKSAEKNNKAKGKNAVQFSRALSRVFVFLCGIVNLFLRSKYKRSDAFKAQKKNGAMLLVSNHLSAFDFIYFTLAMRGAPLNYVVAENMMYSTPIFAKLIKGYHAITKKQYFADVQCIKTIKRNLDAGISVLICPEGKVAADGVTGTIPSSISKLVKWLGYPVGYLNLKGASLARPKWAYNIRKGKIEVECDMLFDAEEVKTLPKEDILSGIAHAIAHNEHKWQIENDVEFYGKRYAEGLHRLLYRCPKCHSEFKMTSNGDHLLCESCGNEIVYTNGGKLVPVGKDSVCDERIDQWFAKQRELVAQEVKNDDFALSNRVELFVENDKNNGYRYVTSGVLTLDKCNLTFESECDRRPLGVKSKFGVNNMECDYNDLKNTEPVEDEFKHLQFGIKNMDTIAFMPGNSVDMYDDKHVYRFMFEEQIASSKYALAIEEMYKLNEEQA